MDELEQTIYDVISEKGQYRYSSDSLAKSAEIQAIKHLESNGYISVRANAIGFVIADTV